MATRPQVIDESIAVLDAVDAALDRLSQGTYRVCEVCGAPIDEAALLADPTLRRCDEDAVADDDGVTTTSP